MFLRRHIAVFWYSTGVLVALLVCLLVPNEIGSDGRGTGIGLSGTVAGADDRLTRESRISELADRSLSSKSQVERASISREVAKIRRDGDELSSGNYVSTIPIKFIAGSLMLIFLSIVFNLCLRRAEQKEASI